MLQGEFPHQKICLSGQGGFAALMLMKINAPLPVATSLLRLSHKSPALALRAECKLLEGNSAWPAALNCAWGSRELSLRESCTLPEEDLPRCVHFGSCQFPFLHISAPSK